MDEKDESWMNLDEKSFNKYIMNFRKFKKMSPDTAKRICGLVGGGKLNVLVKLDSEYCFIPF